MQNNVFDLNNIKKTYLKMAMPVVLGMVVSLVYNLADTFFIAQTGDTNLVAGVSLCAPVFTALMAFGNIYGQGGSSLISRLLGEDDIEGTKRVSSFCFYIAIATGLVLMVLMLIGCDPLLNVLGANEDTFQYAKEYYLVLAVGAPMTVLSFIHSNLVRCEGMATESMLGSVFGTIVNIILDPILISVFNMGAFGAAVATIIGYTCSDIFFLFVLHAKSKILSVDIKKCHVDSRELQQIMGVGFTAAITNLMSSLTTIVLNQSLLPYGTESIAAMGIVLKVNMIAQLILTGFAFGGVPLFGYVYGSKNFAKMKELLRFALIFLCGLSVVLTVILFAFAPSFISVFMGEASIITMGSEMLRYQVISTVFVAIVLLMTVVFQATGKVRPALIMSLSRQGVVFIVVLLACSYLFGYTGVIMSQAVADIISAGIALVLYNAMKKEFA